jgi:CubicO group peptidase (beta-lactamase class C family)
MGERGGIASVGEAMTSATETVRRRESAETEGPAVAGHATPGFAAVREAFVENFERRGELGAACCVYHRGEKVVDLWGGIRNKATGEPSPPQNRNAMLTYQPPLLSRRNATPARRRLQSRNTA